MQKTFKFAVTVGRSENVALEKLAQTWAAKFGVKYVDTLPRRIFFYMTVLYI